MQDGMTDGHAGRRLASGRYRLGQRLGGGGTANVYRAVDTVLDRPVAVKLFLAGTDISDERRFQREVRLLAPLKNPGLVTLYDANVEDGQAFLVMQLIDGVTLRQRLASGPPAPRDVAALGERLASVLAYVHGRGIVHRDVKPSNVLIAGQQPAADGSNVFLADFGISRLVDTTHLTATGLVVGTVAYMAPEQVRGQDVGPPADVYSLGLVLLECLTGEPEFPGGNVEAAVARLARRPNIPDWLPEPMRDALTAMTHDEPAERLSARECAAMLGDRGASGDGASRFLSPGAAGMAAGVAGVGGATMAEGSGTLPDITPVGAAAAAAGPTSPLSGADQTVAEGSTKDRRYGAGAAAAGAGAGLAGAGAGTAGAAGAGGGKESFGWTGQRARWVALGLAGVLLAGAVGLLANQLLSNSDRERPPASPTGETRSTPPTSGPTEPDERTEPPTKKPSPTPTADETEEPGDPTTAPPTEPDEPSVSPSPTVGNGGNSTPTLPLPSLTLPAPEPNPALERDLDPVLAPMVDPVLRSLLQPISQPRRR